MNRLIEKGTRKEGAIQAYRVHDPSEFYLKQQKEKDLAWVRSANEQLRRKANTDILV